MRRLASGPFSAARAPTYFKPTDGYITSAMWKKNLGGCLMVLVAIVGFYVAITLSFTFWALPLAFIIFFACLILISLALGPSDRR